MNPFKFGHNEAVSIRRIEVVSVFILSTCVWFIGKSLIRSIFILKICYSDPGHSIFSGVNFFLKIRAKIEERANFVMFGICLIPDLLWVKAPLTLNFRAFYLYAEHGSKCQKQMRTKHRAKFETLWYYAQVPSISSHKLWIFGISDKISLFDWIQLNHLLFINNLSSF